MVRLQPRAGPRHRDELNKDPFRGFPLHANTHIPQVIGAARRYEISGDMRFHDVADFFFYTVSTGRTYVTGGTSNGESWNGSPRHLSAEWKRNIFDLPNAAAPTTC